MSNVRDGGVALSHMNSVATRRERGLGQVVGKERHPGAAANGGQLAKERLDVARGHVLGPELDRRRMRRQDGGDKIHEIEAAGDERGGVRDRVKSPHRLRGT